MAASTLQSIFAHAWTGQLSAVEWGTKTRIHLLNNGSKEDLSDFFFKQLNVNRVPSPRLLSYIKHALSSNLVEPIGFLLKLTEWVEAERSKRLEVFMSFAADFVPNMKVPENDIKEADNLTQLSVQSLCLLLSDLHDRITKGHRDNRVRSCAKLVNALVSPGHVRVLYQIAQANKNEIWEKAVAYANLVLDEMKRAKLGENGAGTPEVVGLIISCASAVTRAGQLLSGDGLDVVSMFSAPWNERALQVMFLHLSHSAVTSRLLWYPTQTMYARLKALREAFVASQTHSGVQQHQLYEFIFEFVASSIRNIRSAAGPSNNCPIIRRLVGASYAYCMVPAILKQANFPHELILSSVRRLECFASILHDPVQDTADQASYKRRRNDHLYLCMLRALYDKGILPELPPSVSVTIPEPLNDSGLMYPEWSSDFETSLWPFLAAATDESLELGMPASNVLGRTLSRAFSCWENSWCTCECPRPSLSLSYAHLHVAALDLIVKILAHDGSSGVCERLKVQALQFLQEHTHVFEVARMHGHLGAIIKNLVLFCDETGNVAMGSLPSLSLSRLQHSFLLVFEILERFEVSNIDANNGFVTSILVEVKDPEGPVTQPPNDPKAYSFSQWYANFVHRRVDNVRGDESSRAIIDKVVDSMLYNGVGEYGELVMKCSFWETIRLAPSLIYRICRDVAQDRVQPIAAMEQLSALLQKVPHVAPSAVVWFCDEIEQGGEGRLLRIPGVSDDVPLFVFGLVKIVRGGETTIGIPWYMHSQCLRLLRVLKYSNHIFAQDMRNRLNMVETQSTNMLFFVEEQDSLSRNVIDIVGSIHTLRLAFKLAEGSEDAFKSIHPDSHNILNSLGVRRFCNVIVDEILRLAQASSNSHVSGQLAVQTAVQVVFDCGSYRQVISSLFEHVLPLTFPILATPAPAAALALMTFLIIRTLATLTLDPECNVDIRSDYTLRQSISQIFLLAVEILEGPSMPAHIFSSVLFSAIVTAEDTQESDLLKELISKNRTAQALVANDQPQLAMLLFDLEKADERMDVIRLANSSIEKQKDSF